MTIDKAIEFFIQCQLGVIKGTDLPNLPDSPDAFSMVIAALSRIRYQRQIVGFQKELLPGETEE